MRNKLLARLALALAAAEVLLILASWLLSAMPSVQVRSLLSSEGIRWLMGHACDDIASPILVWILLAGIAGGCLHRSGLLSSLKHHSAEQRPHRVRFALWSTLVLLIAYVAVIVLLTAVPHAILLSATGQLFPSPFSASIVPVVALGLCLLSVVYGVVSGSFSALVDVYEATLAGLSAVVVAVLFYMLSMLLYETANFAFG